MCSSLWARRWLGVVLAIVLAGCAASEDSLHEGVADPVLLGVNPEGSAEELYFEGVRLDSLGLLGPGRWAEIQRRLAIVDEVYSQDDDDAVMLRDTLLSQLRLALAETRRCDVLAFEGQQGRAYARRLNRAGVKSAERHAERLVLIAGMVGVPTSAGEGLLMVALPAGGYLIVKAGGMAFKRAVFLLRHCRNADEVVRSARSPGFKVEKVKDDSSLRGALARTDRALSDRFAVVFRPDSTSRLFVAADIRVALLFSKRTVGREGGQVGGVVVALPRDVANRLRKSGLLKTQAVPDIPGFLETIFEPGAAESLRKYGFIEKLPEGFFGP